MSYIVKKTLLGKLRVHYSCPQCKAELESPLEEAGQEFPCPTCQKKLIVPGQQELQRQRDDRAEELRRADEAKQRERELKQAADRAAAAQQVEEQQRRKPQIPVVPFPAPPANVSHISSQQANAIIVLLLLIAGAVGSMPLGLKWFFRPHWEYRIESPSDEDFDSKVNELGDSGWELVFARRATHGEGDSATAAYEMIFKRQK